MADAKAELEAVNKIIKSKGDTTKTEEKLPKLSEPIKGEGKFIFDDDGESQPFNVEGVPKEFGDIKVIKSKKGYYSIIEVSGDTNFIGKSVGFKRIANIDFGKPGDNKYFETPEQALEYAKSVVKEKYLQQSNQLNTEVKGQPEQITQPIELSVEPKPNPSKAAGQPTVDNTLTQEAKDLLKSIGEGSKPTFITGKDGDDAYPQILLTNNHDGKAALTLE